MVILPLTYSFLLIVAFLLALPILLRYLVVPLIARSKQFHEASPIFRPIELPDLPEEIALTFHEAARALAAEGFVAVAHLTALSKLVNGERYISMWKHPIGDSAAVTAIRSFRRTGGVRITTTINFTTRYTNGQEIHTHNRRTPPVFEPNPEIDAVNFYDIADVCRLWRLHQMRVMRANLRLDRKPFPTPGTEVQMMIERIRDGLNYQSSRGLMHFDPAIDGYRYTIRGAYIMTWRLLWPLKQLRHRQMEQISNTLLKELEPVGPPPLPTRQ
jgi:hypothetical protein